MRSLPSRAHLIGWSMAAIAAVTTLASTSAYAIQDCELNGESINTSNGNTTKGKTGLIRCKDRDTGQIEREQGLKDGIFMGVVRHFEKGVLKSEHNVNEKGNRDGRSREFSNGGTTISDNMYENGKHIGLGRWFFDSGKPKRATYYEEDREKASVEWNESGQINRLQCTDKPVLAPAFDDKKACGFSGASQVDMFSSKGVLQVRSNYLEGKRTKYETYYDNGKMQMQQEVSANRRIERRFADDGVKRREIETFVSSETPSRSYKVMEQEFSERGGLVREQRWTNDGMPVSDISYYLNGQPKDKSLFSKEGEVDIRTDSTYFDSGKLATEGKYAMTRTRFRGQSALPVGSHKAFDEKGRVVGESIYDDKGKVTREKSWDENGKLVRDDEVFEDGSRKAYAK